MIKVIELKAPAKVWKELMDLTLWDEIILNVGKTGILHKEVDPAHVALLTVTIDKSMFDFYRIREPKRIGINVDVIKDRLKKIKANEMVTIYYTHTDEMGMIIEKPYGKMHKTFFSIDTAGLAEPKVPNLGLTKIEIDRDYFTDAIQNIGELSDHLTLSLKGKKLTISSKDELDATPRFSKEEEENIKAYRNNVDLEVNYGKDKELKSHFSTDFLMQLFDFSANATSSFIIGIGTDNPLSVTFSKEKDGKKLYDVYYLIAPRIESE